MPRGTEWSGQDNGLAAAMQSRLPRNAWKLLHLLSSEGETETPILVQRLGLNDLPQLNGVNGWVGRVSNEFGRKTPIKSNRGPNGGGVWYVEAEVAALFMRLKG
jgi:hypothetical protein